MTCLLTASHLTRVMQCYQHTALPSAEGKRLVCTLCAPWRHAGDVEAWLFVLHVGTGCRWALSFTPRPLYPLERGHGTRCKGCSVGTNVGMDVSKRREACCPCCESTHHSAASLYHLSCSRSWEICCWTTFHNPDSSGAWDVTSSSRRPF